jgi:hypothetical protein
MVSALNVEMVSDQNLIPVFFPEKVDVCKSILGQSYIHLPEEVME